MCASTVSLFDSLHIRQFALTSGVFRQWSLRRIIIRNFKLLFLSIWVGVSLLQIWVLWLQFEHWYMSMQSTWRCQCITRTMVNFKNLKFNLKLNLSLRSMDSGCCKCTTSRVLQQAQHCTLYQLTHAASTWKLPSLLRWLWQRQWH